jgi:hypothetical protein
MRIAFATCAALPGGNPDEAALAQTLGADWRVWDDAGVDWHAYDRVVLRSVWDYTADRDRFVAWCRAVGRERLRNHPELVAFNSDKRYLRDLGVPVVPTRFVEPDDPVPELEGEVVVKPNVSAGAAATGRFGPGAHDRARRLIREIQASGRTALVQPYLADVDARGEVAVVHFDGEPSHALVKRAVLRPDEVAPLARDVPVVAAAAMFEEDLVVAGEAAPEELALAREVLDVIAGRFGGPPLYARVDMVRGADGAPVLLELEAVEPHLYLDTAPGAAERFAAAIQRADW